MRDQLTVIIVAATLGILQGCAAPSAQRPEAQQSPGSTPTMTAVERDERGCMEGATQNCDLRYQREGSTLRFR